MSKIKQECSRACYFSIMMDEASDLSHKEQVCIIVRYVDWQYVIQERLIDIQSTESTCSDKLFEILCKSLNKVGLTTNLLVGQCYDGASNMKGRFNGLQAKVKEIQPKAIYSHCYAHCMNLVLVEATSSNKYARNFFGTLQSLYNFFEASPHRHAVLESVIKSVISKPKIYSLKKLSDTRWACRSDSIVAVSKNYSAIVKALDEIGEKSQVPKVVSDANALKHLVQQFEFLLCLDVLEDVLLKCRRVSDYLQRDDIDMITWSIQL